MVHYPRPFGLSGHLLSHSNSFGFEMEKDVAGCRAFNRNYIVGDIIINPSFTSHLSQALSYHFNHLN